MGGIEPRVLGIDRDKKLDGLARIQAVEEDRGDIDVYLFFGLGAKGQQSVLTIQAPKDPGFLWNLKHPQVGILSGWGKSKPFLCNHDHGARDGR